MKQINIFVKMIIRIAVDSKMIVDKGGAKFL